MSVSIPHTLFAPVLFRSEVVPLSDIPTLASSRRKPLAPEIARLRAVKSKSEAELMRKAGAISGQAHAKVRRSLITWCSCVIHVGTRAIACVVYRLLIYLLLDRLCVLLALGYQNTRSRLTSNTCARYKVHRDQLMSL
jgi:hypothetical protein